MVGLVDLTKKRTILTRRREISIAGRKIIVKENMACDETESNRKRARLELQKKEYFNNCTLDFN